MIEFSDLHQSSRKCWLECQEADVAAARARGEEVDDSVWTKSSDLVSGVIAPEQLDQMMAALPPPPRGYQRYVGLVYTKDRPWITSGVCFFTDDTSFGHTILDSRGFSSVLIPWPYRVAPRPGLEDGVCKVVRDILKVHCLHHRVLESNSELLAYLNT